MTLRLVLRYTPPAHFPDISTTMMQRNTYRAIAIAILVPWHAVFATGNPGIDAAISGDPVSAIEGTVTGPDGVTPVYNIEVSANYFDGNSWVWAGGNFTDENGHYIIGNLAANTYRLDYYDYSGLYVYEIYNNAPDFASGTDVVVPAGTLVSGIDVSLASTGGELEAPGVVGIQPAGPDRFDIVYTGRVGQAYILQEAIDLTNTWSDIDPPIAVFSAINTITRTQTLHHAAWRIRIYP